MIIITILAACSLFLTGAVFYIECKIVEDLPDSNAFKKWWRKHVIYADPKG